MTEASEQTPLFPELGDRLRDEAEELTDEWLERLGDRLGVRPARLLPTEDLRDHIPVVIRGAADFLSQPVAQPPNETVDILRTVAQLRREQGYDIQEILTEFGILSDLVFDRVAEWAGTMEDLDAASAMRAAARLTSVLRTIASVAVGTYREEELRHQRELAAELAEFASMVSHELRNPISTAAISAELLVSESAAADAAERQKHVDRIQSRLKRMEHLLDDLQAMAVAENARAREHWAPVRRIVQSILEEAAPAAEREGVELHVDWPDEEFEVDAVRVEIALMNLVNNAIKFSDPDKDERWVRIRFAGPERAGLERGRQIVVEDNGVGIDPESRNKVFQRFFRENPEIEGTGLGLAITRRVVEQRGGRLWFESEKGSGSTFYVEIPERLGSGEAEAGQVRR